MLVSLLTRPQEVNTHHNWINSPSVHQQRQTAQASTAMTLQPSWHDTNVMLNILRLLQCSNNFIVQLQKKSSLACSGLTSFMQRSVFFCVWTENEKNKTKIRFRKNTKGGHFRTGSHYSTTEYCIFTLKTVCRIMANIKHPDLVYSQGFHTSRAHWRRITETGKKRICCHYGVYFHLSNAD